jgi:hypothetical protein
MPLAPAWHGPWLVLAPTGPTPAGLQALCDDLVHAVHPLREPPSADELARRRASGLTRRQEELLARWGYALLLDEFRFHLTLAGPVPEAAERGAVEALAMAWFEELATGELRVDDVAIVCQPAPDRPFAVVERIPLGVT